MSVLFPCIANSVFGPPPGFRPREWAERSLARLQGKYSEWLAGSRAKPFVFMNEAGVGSGKTIYSAMVAAAMMKERAVDGVVFVCPNKIIRRKVREVFASFGIGLVEWSNKRHACGWPSDFHGAVMTYQSLSASAEAWRKRSAYHRFLVIFDEIHHLADGLDWGDKAGLAFNCQGNIILAMSGTPFRADSRRIPFVEFHQAGESLYKIRSDFTYSLGQAVADGVCCHPYFYWLNTSAVIDGQERILADCTENFELANQVLAESIMAGSPSRLDMLRESLVQLDVANIRKVIIFIGGDSRAAQVARSIYDAEQLLPRELISLGVSPDDIVSVTSESLQSVELIADFNTNSKRFLVTVNMVSEGVDIPSLQAAIFLSAITAKSTTIQRIGRLLRGSGTVWVLMPKHPSHVKLASDVMTDIGSEMKIRDRTACDDFPGGRSDKSSVEPRVGCGIAAWRDGMTLGGHYFSQDDCDDAREVLLAERLPVNNEMIAAWLRVNRRDASHAS